MIDWNDSVEVKTGNEQAIDNMRYNSTLDWRYMKKLKSETNVRHWHIKIANGAQTESGNIAYDDWNVAQVWIARRGERLYAFPASRSGRPLDVMNFLFDMPGKNHLQGIEYLLRSIEGQDIEDIELSTPE